MNNDIATVAFIVTGFAALIGLLLVAGEVTTESKAPGRFILVGIVWGAAFVSCYASGFNPVIFLPVVAAGFTVLGRAMWVANFSRWGNRVKTMWNTEGA